MTEKRTQKAKVSIPTKAELLRLLRSHRRSAYPASVNRLREKAAEQALIDFDKCPERRRLARRPESARKKRYEAEDRFRQESGRRFDETETAVRLRGVTDETLALVEEWVAGYYGD